MPAITVFCSGAGTNLQALIDAGCDIRQVICNRECQAAKRAEQAGIPTLITSALSPKDVDPQVELIVLAGYLKILPPQFVAAFAGRIINTHPALLPRYGGKGMFGLHVHQAVLAAKEKESGCSVHLVTDQVDGGRVLAQRKVPVLPDDTPKSLQERVINQEHQLLVEIVKNWDKNCPKEKRKY